MFETGKPKSAELQRGVGRLAALGHQSESWGTGRGREVPSCPRALETLEISARTVPHKGATPSFSEGDGSGLGAGFCGWEMGRRGSS